MNGDELIVDARAVVRTYGSGEALVRAIDGVDLDARAGELVLIMGPSGSGKTTLLTLLGGLLRPDSGRIFIAGEEITGMRERDLTALRRQRVGFVFQSSNLLKSLSASENVQVALNFAGVRGREAQDRAVAALTDMGLDHRLDYLPRHLSGGERQRVSIARALVTDPALLLADEPTANLDSVHGKEIMEILKNITSGRGKTAVVVSHDHRIREASDRVLWLEDGKFSELGGVVRDPNCGMQVEVEEAYPLVVDDERLYFCSKGCRSEYMDTHGNPQPEVD